MVRVKSGKATLAAAYEVTGDQLATYLEWAQNGLGDSPSVWRKQPTKMLDMCLFDGDLTTMTPGPPEADRSAVRVLVVISDGEALLWAIGRKGQSALPIIDPATLVPGSPLPTDPREVLLTGSEAIERLVAFVGEPDLTSDLTAQGPTDGAFIRGYNISGKDVSAFVNAHDGTVASLLIFANAGFGGVTIDADRAVEVAQDFLKTRQVPFDGLDRSVRFQDHGDASEYVVEWIGHEGDVVAPNSREVGVDASTGHVFRYTYVNRPYDPPSEPLVDRETAEATAIRAVNGSRGTQVDRSELLITFTPSDVQRLVWQVYVTDGFSHWVVEVDAETGTASVIASG